MRKPYVGTSQLSYLAKGMCERVTVLMVMMPLALMSWLLSHWLIGCYYVLFAVASCSFEYGYML